MKKVVIKLGGSLFSTGEENMINYDYLSALRKTLDKFIEKDYKFAIVVGGGYLCRKYQSMAVDKGSDNPEDLDWIGIASINLNAEMVRNFFGDRCEKSIVRYNDYKTIEDLVFEKPVKLCAAEKPGHSSDVDAVEIAKFIDSKTIYRLTDVDAIYTKDPNKHPDAKALENINWQEYYKILGINEFEPGGHYPIDPIAARMSEERGLSFYLMEGNNLDSLINALNGDKFKGTIIS